MNVKTRQFLHALDTNTQDEGVSLQEIKTLDQNGDGKISMKESQGQLSPQDLNAINQRYKAANSAVNQVTTYLPFLADMGDDFTLYSRAELNSTLFPQGVEGIHPNDIQQGGLGDCFFLASLASLAQQRPHAIVDMIQDLGHGNYRVKFPGAKFAVEVNEKDKSWAHTGRDSKNQRNHSRWVQILESAFVQYVGRTHTGTAKTKVENTATGFLDGLLTTVSPGIGIARHLLNSNAPPKTVSAREAEELFDWGGFQGDAVKILTGHSVDDDILALTRNSTLRSKLSSHLKRGSIISASTFMGGSDAKNIADRHVYSVLDFDAQRDIITIRNPHGRGSDAVGLRHTDGLDDGIYQMTLAEFNSYFTAITYEEN